jgi:hypothetical protein
VKSAQLSKAEEVNVRENVSIRGQPYEEYFIEMCFRPVLDCDGVNAWSSGGPCVCSVLGSGSESKMLRDTPRSSTPQVEIFFNKNCLMVGGF